MNITEFCSTELFGALVGVVALAIALVVAFAYDRWAL